MDDRNGSTTPPLPPPEASESETQPPPQQSSETLQSQQPSSQSPPTSAQAEREEPPVEPTETKDDEPQMESRLPRSANMRTPEPRLVPVTKSQANINPNTQTNGRGHVVNNARAADPAPERSPTPETPGNVTDLPSFDWDDLEARFEKALAGVNEHEQGLMSEFEALVKYFNVWASAASAHDNERATKRLQTRAQFVQLREADLEKKKQYYEQVMQAFQNAMHLLNQA